jgi:uncharacterized integral membrane protein (TIGR00698 family)
MQQLAEPDAQPDRVDVRSSRKRKNSARRKVTVRLSEAACSRLDVATDRPGVGKSILVEAALAQFLDPSPSREALLLERLEDMHARFDHLERDMQVIGETVALHARYHLAVVPPIPQSWQRQATIVGDERFKVLAEQVDRRVRERRPLMQETINRLNLREHQESRTTTGGGPTQNSEPVRKHPSAASAGVHFEKSSVAPAETAGGGPPVARRPKATAGRIKSFSDEAANLEVEQKSDSESSTANLGAAREKPLSNWRLILSVFLPFAAGYYLTFLFRTINAPITPLLASDFGLGAAETGLLGSVYFLVFAGSQIPIGVLLDRYGPKRVQSVLLVIAVGGAALFGNAVSLAELLIGRAMIGLGVAGAFMAGLKAIVVWFPRDRIAFVNGCMIVLGSLGAVTATAPTDWLLNWIGWRSLFEILTISTLATAALIYFVVPEPDVDCKRPVSSTKPLTLGCIFSDPRFLRIVPLSATCIGSSWAMHSLWAACWLAEVEGLNRQGVINQLLAMAIAITMGALLLGIVADRLRKCAIATEILLAGLSALFMLAELALIVRLPLPSILPWSVVSIMGAATVLSYAIIADYFPIEVAARANGALNLMHCGWAFAVQCGIGFIVGRWVPQDGHYPVVAYQAAFTLTLALQATALAWFAMPWLGSFFRNLLPLSGLAHYAVTSAPPAAEGLILDSSRGTVWPSRPAPSRPGIPAPGPILRALIGWVPGIALCAGISASAVWLQDLQEHAFGHPYVEALVIAIVLGALTRNLWQPSAVWRDGIALSAKTLLEIAVMLLGSSISLATIVASGPELLAGIAVAVVAALAASYATSRALGLPQRISILIACGNSICGNSAIAAVAPIIGADSDDVASSIAFTAILGVVVVLALPLLIPLLDLSQSQYGVLAGLTVYAVPQVLAATLPISPVSAQLGTMVKLMRVLMLGPVVVLLSLLLPKLNICARRPAPFKRRHLVPWFILGFLALAALRAIGLIPQSTQGLMAAVASWLTIISMAALGLGVDIRNVGRAGGTVTLAVVISWIVLIVIGTAIIWLLRLA